MYHVFTDGSQGKNSLRPSTQAKETTLSRLHNRNDEIQRSGSSTQKKLDMLETPSQHEPPGTRTRPPRTRHEAPTKKMRCGHNYKYVPQGVRGGIPEAVERRLGDQGPELPEARQAARPAPRRNGRRVLGPETPGQGQARGRVEPRVGQLLHYLGVAEVGVGDLAKRRFWEEVV